MKRTTGSLGALLATGLFILSACGDSATLAPSAIGTLERDRIELVSEAFEPIVEVAASEGDSVKSGDLILRLDPAIVDSRLAVARASLSQADATLRLAVRGPRGEQIAEGRSRLAAAEGALLTASQELLRHQRLVEQEIETPSVLDRARGLHDQALGQRDEARAVLDALIAGTTSEELDQARAALAVAEATILELVIDRERLEIRSPVDARVDALPLKLGSRPAVGATVAVLLVDQQPYARVHVPAKVWEQLELGAEADLRIDGQAGTWRGRLRTLSSEASFTPYYALTRFDRGRLSYLAEIDLLDEAAASFRNGATVEVFFDGLGTEE